MSNKKIIRILYSALVIALILLSSYSLYRYTNQVKENTKVKNSIKEEVSIIENTKTLEEYRKYYSNEDIIGSLKIEDTKIDTLLVKALDNEYYLEHSIKKEEVYMLTTELT